MRTSRGQKSSAQTIALAGGAEARVTNGVRPRTAVLVDGGQAAEVAGTWSPSLEWLVRRLAPRHADVGFVELRYRVKSWRRLDLCVEDATAALDAAVDGGARGTLLIGFSMGAAVATLAAGHPTVAGVVGLAPWLPDELPLAELRGKRVAIVHGALDRALPGIPGVTPSQSRRAYERIRELPTVDADYTLIPGALHGVALRGRWGLTPLPRARSWAKALAAELERFSRAREPAPV